MLIAVMLSAVMLSVIAPLLLLLLPSLATLKNKSFYLIIRLAIILFSKRYFLLCSEYSKTSLRHTYAGCYVEMAKNGTTTLSITQRNMFDCDAQYLRHYA